MLSARTRGGPGEVGASSLDTNQHRLRNVSPQQHSHGLPHRRRTATRAIPCTVSTGGEPLAVDMVWRSEFWSEPTTTWRSLQSGSGDVIGRGGVCSSFEPQPDNSKKSALKPFAPELWREGVVRKPRSDGNTFGSMRAHCARFRLRHRLHPKVRSPPRPPHPPLRPNGVRRSDSRHGIHHLKPTVPFFPQHLLLLHTKPFQHSPASEHCCLPFPLASAPRGRSCTSAPSSAGMPVGFGSCACSPVRLSGAAALKQIENVRQKPSRGNGDDDDDTQAGEKKNDTSRRTRTRWWYKSRHALVPEGRKG